MSHGVQLDVPGSHGSVGDRDGGRRLVAIVSLPDTNPLIGAHIEIILVPVGLRFSHQARSLGVGVGLVGEAAGRLDRHSLTGPHICAGAQADLRDVVMIDAGPGVVQRNEPATTSFRFRDQIVVGVRLDQHVGRRVDATLDTDAARLHGGHFSRRVAALENKTDELILRDRFSIGVSGGEDIDVVGLDLRLLAQADADRGLRLGEAPRHADSEDSPASARGHGPRLALSQLKRKGPAVLDLLERLTSGAHARQIDDQALTTGPRPGQVDALLADGAALTEGSSARKVRPRQSHGLSRGRLLAGVSQLESVLAVSNHVIRLAVHETGDGLLLDFRQEVGNGIELVRGIDRDLVREPGIAVQGVGLAVLAVPL